MEYYPDLLTFVRAVAQTFCSSQVIPPNGWNPTQPYGMDWVPLNTLWLFNIAMGNDPFIDGLPIKNGDFPWLC